MTQLTDKKLTAWVISMLSEGHIDMDTDNDGQVVIYTGVYEHDDGKYYTYPQDDHTHA